MKTIPACKSKNHESKKRRKQYDSENMKKAIAAVKEDGYSYRQAGDKFGVPWPTLYRKLKVPEKADCTSGPPTVLEDHQEDEIVSWMNYRAERGYPVSKLDLLNGVAMYVTDFDMENPFTDSKPGRHWYEGFIKRHPNVVVGPTQKKTLEQSSSTDHLQEWFCKMKIYLRNKDLLNIDASRIFNSDEMIIPLVPTAKNFNSGSSDSKNFVTTLVTYSADGTQAPPLVMYKFRNYMPKDIIQNCPGHWGIGLSESGGIVARTYFEYITNVFYPWLLKKNVTFPIIVYIDKHAPLVSVPLAIFCIEKKIELMALLPNFSHLIQPLNVALLRPFESAWIHNVNQYRIQHEAKRLRKDQFPMVLNCTLDSLDEKNLVIEGFKAAGLVPFDPKVIDYNALKKKKYKTAKNPEGEERPSIMTSELFQEKLHLKTFEANIPIELLSEFKMCETNETWTGNIEKRGMFEYWLRIKKAANDSEMANASD